MPTNQSYKTKLKELFDGTFRGDVIRSYSPPYSSSSGQGIEYIIDSIDLSLSSEPRVFLIKSPEDNSPFQISLSQFLNFETTGKKLKLAPLAQTSTKCKRLPYIPGDHPF